MATGRQPTDELTTSTKIRWIYLASLVAGTTVTTFLGLIVAGALGTASLGAIPQAWFGLLSIMVLSATAWTFGRLYTEYKQAKQG